MLKNEESSYMIDFKIVNYNGVVPKVSVIIPVYKVEEFIDQAMESLVNQTYRNLQIILVDDGSPDRSGSICEMYAKNDCRIFVIHKKNEGVSAARNAGLDVANGEWIYFMDPDDWIELNTIEICMEKALRTKADMVIFGRDRFKGERRWKIRRDSVASSNSDQLFQKLDSEEAFLRYVSSGASLWNILFRRSILDDQLRLDTELTILEDGVFKSALYMKLRSFLCIPNVLYHYRVRPGSITEQKDFCKIFNMLLVARKKYLLLYEGGTYPTNARKLANSIFLSSTITRMMGILIEDRTLSYKEKKAIILSAFRSTDMREASKEYDPRMVSMGTNMVLKFYRCPVHVIYLFYELKKVRIKLQSIWQK